jgi:hypothetical protein
MAKLRAPKKETPAATSRARKAPKLARVTGERARPATEFSVEDRVVHPQFGEGKVLTVHAEKLTIQFKTSGIKEVLKGFVDRRR